MALLFLTRGNPHQIELWREFFSGYADRFSVYVHAKYADEVTESWMRSAMIREHYETNWGRLSLVRATLALIRAALQETENYKFVLLSESCVPIKPASYLLRAMEEQPLGHLSWETYGTSKSRRFLSIRGLSLLHFRSQAQWMILTRQMAEIIVENDCLEAFADAVIPDESYFATTLSKSGFDLETGVVNMCPTFVKWVQPPGTPPGTHGKWRPLTYSTVTEEQIDELRASSAFFCRKFSVESDIRRYRLHVD